jgi:MinD superfamily P-loop ATPase
MSAYEQNTRKEAISERFHTNKEGSTICSVCHFAARQEAIVAQQFRYVHENIREQKCDMCNYSTALKEDLELHVNFVHDKIRIHKCIIPT